jgi:uncharacterized protein
MDNKKQILSRIKQIIEATDPDATVILFGSHARGDSKEGSDIDLLVLINAETISYEDERRIKYPLYDLEFETGCIISPLVISRGDWEQRHSITPFYENVKQEGVLL